MPEEHSQTVMAVDELQAIIQRCVSSFLFLEVTSVSSVSFFSYIRIKPKMTSEDKSVVSRTLRGAANFSLYVSLTSLWCLSQDA